MDRLPFLPPALALSKGVGLILSVALGSMTIKHGVQKCGHAEVSTYATPPAYQVPIVAAFGQGFELSQTSRFVDANDRLLDYYGRPIDIDELLANKPSSSYTTTHSAPPLTVASPAPSSPLSTARPSAPQSTHPHPSSTTRTFIPEFLPQGSSNSDIFLSWIELILTFWLSPLHKYVDATYFATPGDGISRIWRIVWLIAYRLFLAIVRRGAVAWVQYLWKAFEIQKTLRAKITSSINTEGASPDQIMEVILQHSQESDAKMSATDACTLKTTSEESEARQPKVTVEPSNVQAECQDGSVEKTTSPEEEGAGFEPSEDKDGLLEKTTAGEAQESSGPAKESTDSEQVKAAHQEPEQQAELHEEGEETITGTHADAPRLEEASEQQTPAADHPSPTTPSEAATPPEALHPPSNSDQNPAPEEPKNPTSSNEPAPDPYEGYIMPEEFQDRSDADLEADEAFQRYVAEFEWDDLEVNPEDAAREDWTSRYPAYYLRNFAADRDDDTRSDTTEELNNAYAGHGEASGNVDG